MGQASPDHQNCNFDLAVTSTTPPLAQKRKQFLVEALLTCWAYLYGFIVRSEQFLLLSSFPYPEVKREINVHRDNCYLNLVKL